MNDDPKQAMEELIAALFKEILNLARSQNISVKQMREMLPAVQIRALAEEGLNQQEIMAESGYTRKWIREILAETPRNGSNSIIDQFVSNWASDKRFPDRLNLTGKYPTFQDLHDLYGGDFTIASLLKILKAREIITQTDQEVVLDPARKVTATATAELIQAAQASMTALLGTLSNNIIHSEKKFTERRMWSSSIPMEKLEALRNEIVELNLEYRRKVLDSLAKHQVEPNQKNVNYAPPVGVGLYWYERPKR